jgi:hypothetical protein
MKSVLALVSLAVGAVSAQGGSQEFNASALTLREVGARNTLVCTPSKQALQFPYQEGPNKLFSSI